MKRIGWPVLTWFGYRIVKLNTEYFWIIFSNQIIVRPSLLGRDLPNFSITFNCPDIFCHSSLFSIQKDHLFINLKESRRCQKYFLIDLFKTLVKSSFCGQSRNHVPHFLVTNVKRKKGLNTLSACSENKIKNQI